MGGSDRGGWPSVPGHELTRLIGRGGFGSVYEARQTSIGRIVAIKVLPGSAFGEDTERRFRSECRTIGSLSWHPHVVSLFDAGTTNDGGLYLAMEYVAGGSLAGQVHQDGPLEPSVVASVGIEIADALAAAHEAGVLHRDVKPDNILVDQRGRHLLSDFGIATLDDGTRSTTGSFTGTYAYTAPELVQGERATPQSDGYSLGATLYALAAGQSAFASSTDATPAALLMRILTQPAAPLPTTIPPVLAAIIEQAMAKDPSQRPGSAASLKQALEQLGLDPGAPLVPAVPSVSPALQGLAARSSERATPDPVAPGEATTSAIDDITLARPPGGFVDPIPLAPPDPQHAVVVAPEPGDGTDPEATVLRGTANPRPELNDLPAEGDAVPPPLADAGRRRGLTVLVGAVIAVIALVVGAFLLLGRGSEGREDERAAKERAELSEATTTKSEVPTTETTKPVPTEPSVEQEVSVSMSPTIIAADASGVWLGDYYSGTTVEHLDPATAKALASVEVGSTPSAIAIADGSAWVAVYEAGKVVHLDSGSGKVMGTVDTGGTPSGLVVTAEAVWVTDYETDSVLVIDPSTHAVAATIPVGSAPGDIAEGMSSLWVANRYDGTVSRIDPSTRSVIATYSVGLEDPSANGINKIAVTDDAVWVTAYGGEDAPEALRLIRLDAASGFAPSAVDLPPTVSAITGDGDTLWAGVDGNLLEIRSKDSKVLSATTVGADALDLTRGTVWAASYGGQVTKVAMN